MTNIYMSNQNKAWWFSCMCPCKLSFAFNTLVIYPRYSKYSHVSCTSESFTFTILMALFTYLTSLFLLCVLSNFQCHLFSLRLVSAIWAHAQTSTCTTMDHFKGWKMSKVFVVCQGYGFFCCDLLKPAAPGEHNIVELWPISALSL